MTSDLSLNYTRERWPKKVATSQSRKNPFPRPLGATEWVDTGHPDTGVSGHSGWT